MATKIAFYYGWGTTWWKSIQTIAIMVFTMGRYTHCELINTNNSDKFSDWSWYAASAYGDARVRVKKGFIPKLDSPTKTKYWDIHDISDECLFNEDKLYEFFERELGKRYDWKAIFLAQFLPINKHEKDKWFCSEIIRAALAYAGAIKEDKEHHQYNPNELHKELIKKEILK